MLHHSRKIPSEYRCLKALYPTAIALLILSMWNMAELAICSLTLSTGSPAVCQVSMPAPLLWVLFVFVSWGLIHFIYRLYRDFYRGDYYADLSEYQ